MKIVPVGEKHGERIWDCEWQDQGRRFHRRLRARTKGAVLSQIADLCAASSGRATPWTDAVRDYLQAKRAEGRSEDYLRDLDECCAWTLPRLAPIVQDTTLDQVAAAVRLKAGETTPRTGNKHWHHIRAIARWLQSEGRANDLPFLRFKSLHEAPTARRALSAADVSKYLQALPAQVQLPVAFCAAAAIRTGAVVRLNRADLSPGAVAVIEKRKKVRLLERDPWLDAIISRALARPENRPDAEGVPLFGTHRGRRWKGPALLQAAQRAWRQAGLLADMTIHELCRHSPATLAGAAGHEVDELRSYLGHDSRRTSERYVHRDEPTAARVRAKVAPGLVGFLRAADLKRGDSGVLGSNGREEIACPCCGHKFFHQQEDARKSMP